MNVYFVCGFVMLRAGSEGVVYFQHTRLNTNMHVCPED